MGFIIWFVACLYDTSSSSFEGTRTYAHLIKCVCLYHHQSNPTSITHTPSREVCHPIVGRVFPLNHLYPTFFPAGGEPVRRSDHFWARSSAELKVIQIVLYASYDRAGETPNRPPSIYRQASAYSSSIFGTRPRSGYTSELAGRIYLDHG